MDGGGRMDERLFSMEAEFFKALAHPTRVRILKHLREGEKSRQLKIRTVNF